MPIIFHTFAEKVFFKFPYFKLNYMKNLPPPPLKSQSFIFCFSYLSLESRKSVKPYLILFYIVCDLHAHTYNVCHASRTRKMTKKIDHHFQFKSRFSYYHNGIFSSSSSLLCRFSLVTQATQTKYLFRYLVIIKRQVA